VYFLLETFTFPLSLYQCVEKTKKQVRAYQRLLMEKCVPLIRVSDFVSMHSLFHSQIDYDDVKYVTLS